MAFIKIHRENFSHNLNQIALQTGSIDKLAIVLKDNAYGHGLLLIAELASGLGIKHAVVRKLKEAKAVDTLFETVLILGDTIVKHPTFSFAINTLEAINKAENGAKVELKVDTGMHRNGIAFEELSLALEMIQERGLELVGVMTHYRSADVLSSELFWQQKLFEQVKERVKAAGFTAVRMHSHNSATILRMKHFTEDLVRVGIASYGYNELPTPFDNITLKPVLSLHAKKMATRTLKKGQRVGYGGDYTAPKDMQVSTYDLGYGDGWHRGKSNHAYCSVEGYAILGRVSMDSMTFSSEKEELCIMDNAQKAGKHFSTISYEILTALDRNIEKSLL